MFKLDKEFIAAINEIENSRGITRKRIKEMVGNAIKSAYIKIHGRADNLIVEVDIDDKFVIEAFLARVVVEEPTILDKEISIDDAKNYHADAEIGDTVLVEVNLSKLDMSAVHHFRQKFLTLLKEEERELIFEQFKDKLHDIFLVTITHVDRKEVYVQLGRIEGIIPFNEQIPFEKYLTGNRIKVVLTEVRHNRKYPMLVFSRSHPDLIKRLMENEIPEIRDENIEIVSVARDPGYRSKVAVRSLVADIDPVGSCIGSKGIRITAISNELGDEKIDLIEYRDDPFDFIAECLSPVRPLSIEIFEDKKLAIVQVPKEKTSLAIGKKYRNVTLASRLTRYHIEVVSAEDDQSVARVEKRPANRKKNEKSL